MGILYCFQTVDIGIGRIKNVGFRCQKGLNVIVLLRAKDNMEEAPDVGCQISSTRVHGLAVQVGSL
jgi:hypothetical protein